MRVILLLLFAQLAGCSCDPDGFWGARPSSEGEGEGDAAEGEGDVGEGEEVRIFAADTCDITTEPASIDVHPDVGFFVTWTNLGSSAAPVDIDKIDQFNQVPLVIDLEPGQTVTDDVREWCAPLFSGTFEFRITSCFDPHFLEVNCSAP